MSGKVNYMDMVSEVESLPMLSPGLVKLMSLASNPEINTDLLVAEIENNQSTLIKLLRIANSAYYRAIDPILDAKTAVVRIGSESIGALITSIVLSGSFDVKKSPSFDKTHHWLESMMVGFIISELTRAEDDLQKEDRDFLYTAGLLHNLGLMVMVHLFSETMEEVLCLSQPGDEKFEQVMGARFGFDQYQVLGLLLRSWEMPNKFVDVLENLGSFAEDNDNSIFINRVRLARQIFYDVLLSEGGEKSETTLKEEHEFTLARAQRNYKKLSSLALSMAGS